MATTAIKNGATNGNALQRCVSLANGALSPDQRVNYEFGLVLGVDDFRQEQLYFLARDYLHNRSLHGYGTVAGLDVIADRPADSTREMLVTVTPGMAVDQFGRTINLRDEQCAVGCVVCAPGAGRQRAARRRGQAGCALCRRRL